LKCVELEKSSLRAIDSTAFEVQVTSEKKTFDFLIAGVPYKLKSSHDDATVQELVEFVNNKMNQALAVTKNGSFQNAAVLTAMNVAEELILLKRRAHRELEKLEEKALQLSLDLENSKSNTRVANN
jgi:cell division protein ZapA